MSVLMLMTIGGLAAAMAAVIFAVWTKKDWLKNFVIGATAIWLIGYAISLFADSLFIPPNEKLSDFSVLEIFSFNHKECVGDNRNHFQIETQTVSK